MPFAAFGSVVAAPDSWRSPTTSWAGAAGGHEDETISSRAGKAARKGKRWACVL